MRQIQDGDEPVPIPTAPKREQPAPAETWRPHPSKPGWQINERGQIRTPDFKPTSPWGYFLGQE